MNTKTNFTFFGTGNFAVIVLNTLKKDGFIPDLIVTTPDKPKGRKMILTPSDVKVWAQENNINFIQPNKLKEATLPLGSVASKLFIVAEYGKIIPKQILDIPKYGTLNVHPSLLPKFRGPSPIQSFILSGEEKTGTTIISMDEEVDHGPILSTKELEIRKLNYNEFEQELAELGGKLLLDVIPKWISKDINAKEQNHSMATFSKKISKQDGLIDLNESPEIIERKIKAFTHWPGTYFFINYKRIIITDAEIVNNKLIIKKVKPEGKNEMNLEDFLRGHKDANEQLKKFLA